MLRDAPQSRPRVGVVLGRLAQPRSRSRNRGGFGRRRVLLLSLLLEEKEELLRVVFVLAEEELGLQEAVCGADEGRAPDAHVPLELVRGKDRHAPLQQQHADHAQRLGECAGGCICE